MSTGLQVRWNQYGSHGAWGFRASGRRHQAVVTPTDDPRRWHWEVRTAAGEVLRSSFSLSDADAKKRAASVLKEADEFGSDAVRPIGVNAGGAR